MMTVKEARAAIEMGWIETGLSVDMILARAMRLAANQEALPLTAAAAAEEVLRDFCWLRDEGEDIDPELA